jgi:DnaJ-class molecular chaperone
MRKRTLSTPINEGQAMSVEWWQDPNQDVDAAERICVACRGRGVDRWAEDCSECGGLGVCFD